MNRIILNGMNNEDFVTVDTATTNYHLESDSVLMYLNEYPDIDNTMVSSTYEAYEIYCEENNNKPVSNSKFSRRIKSMGYDIQIKKIKGKTYRFFVKN